MSSCFGSLRGHVLAGHRGGRGQRRPVPFTVNPAKKPMIPGAYANMILFSFRSSWGLTDRPDPVLPVVKLVDRLRFRLRRRPMRFAPPFAAGAPGGGGYLPRPLRPPALRCPRAQPRHRSRPRSHRPRRLVEEGVGKMPPSAAIHHDGNAICRRLPRTSARFTSGFKHTD